MLEHVPAWLGRALSGVRAGTGALACAQEGLGAGDLARLSLSSPAFADGARMPDRFTADGAGASPPLTWGAPPAGTERLALLVEDADSPTGRPLVHAVVWNLGADAGTLAEGAIAADGPGSEHGRAEPDVGRNSYFREGWLPPDPPTGHGEHRYVFQLFALGARAGDGGGAAGGPGDDPGRTALLDAMRGRVLAVGLLTGTYSRQEEAPVGPVGAAGAAPA